jgi:hypothetical protein
MLSPGPFEVFSLQRYPHGKFVKLRIEIRGSTQLAVFLTTENTQSNLFQHTDGRAVAPCFVLEICNYCEQNPVHLLHSLCVRIEYAVLVLDSVSLRHNHYSIR